MLVRVKIAPWGRHESNPLWGGRMVAMYEQFDAEGINLALARAQHEPIYVYRGFPLASTNTTTGARDPRPKGFVARLLATPFGLEADAHFNQDGLELLRGNEPLHAADHGYFERIQASPLVYRFVGLKAIGLTPRPMMPIPPIKLPPL